MKKHFHKPLVFIDINQIWPLLHQTITDECVKNNWQLIFEEIFFKEIPSQYHSKIDAVITDRFYNDPLLKNFIKNKIPIIRVGDIVNKKSDEVIPAVIGKLESLGNFAAEYFAQRNFKNLAYVGNKTPSIFVNSTKSFISRAKSLNMETHILLLDPIDKFSNHSSSFSQYTKKVGEWLKTIPRPVGLFAYNDKQAMRLCYICQQSKLRVPEDVAILGIGNEAKYCQTAHPPLSSIEPYHRNIGVTAIQLLHDIMQNKPIKNRLTIVKPVRVIERSSTDILATKDKILSDALKII